MALFVALADYRGLGGRIASDPWNPGQPVGVHPVPQGSKVPRGRHPSVTSSLIRSRNLSGLREWAMLAQWGDAMTAVRLTMRGRARLPRRPGCWHA